MLFSSNEKETGQLNKEKLDLILKQFRTEGYVLLKDIFSKIQIQQLHKSLIKDYSKYFENKAHKDALNVGDKRFFITINVKGEFNTQEVYCNPLILKILSNLLEPDFVISDLTCVASLPGSEQMHIHQDGTIYNNSPIKNLLSPFAIGLLIPLISFDETNGTTRVWPGSHTLKKNMDEAYWNSGFVDLNIDFGSAILMDFRLHHSGNPNKSDRVRPLLICNYCNPWYFDVGNFKNQAYFHMSDEEFTKVPPEHRKMFIRRNIDLSPSYRLLSQKA
ncbi:MAG: phytanoyl-CoA dioxygenase family protein [Roseivirga sp.]|nr:phytanoyl-CoA dioxygenase family protein [Roseivirga sp.]